MITMIKSSNDQPINFSINPDHVRIQSSMLGRVNKAINTIKNLRAKYSVFYEKDL